MPRRSPYTKVLKKNQIREAHVKGMGDIVFKGFQCLNPSCKYFMFVKKDELGDELIKIRNRILKHTKIDFFKHSSKISVEWIKREDERL